MSQRALDLRAGIRIEWFTLVWMALEAVVSVGAGLAAGSVALIAFGADSGIEFVTGGAVLWRLRLESAGVIDIVRAEQAERRASRIVGWSLLLLAGYVVIHSLYDLVTRAASESSPIGIAVAIAALVVMPPLARRKRGIASAIGSPALRGDAASAVVCAYMAATLLAGLVLRAALGWWWADPLAALGIVYFIVREGREALSGQECC